MAQVYCVASDCVFNHGALDCRFPQVDLDWEGCCTHYKTLGDFIRGFTPKEAEVFVEMVAEEQNE